jgi:hypothetical protein
MKIFEHTKQNFTETTKNILQRRAVYRNYYISHLVQNGGLPACQKPYLGLFPLKAQRSDSESDHSALSKYGHAPEHRAMKMRRQTSTSALERDELSSYSRRSTKETKKTPSPAFTKCETVRNPPVGTGLVTNIKVTATGENRTPSLQPYLYKLFDGYRLWVALRPAE